MSVHNFIDMTGWVMAEHGVPDSRLTVIERADDYVSPTGKHSAQWLCRCSCDQHNTVIVRGLRLRQGITKSCGCIHKEQIAARSYDMRKLNTYELNLVDQYGVYGIGYCNNTNDKFYFDMDDYDKIKQYTWYAMTSGHYCTVYTDNVKNKSRVAMHQLIAGKYYDHADRNPLNNRKYNLRYATQSENARNHNKRKDNTSGFTGVAWSKGKQVWHARITVDNKDIHLGYFKDMQDAIRTRLEAEAKYFGEFAPQRHLFEEYGVTIQNELEVTDAKEMDSET